MRLTFSCNDLSLELDRYIGMPILIGRHNSDADVSYRQIPQMYVSSIYS